MIQRFQLLHLKNNIILISFIAGKSTFQIVHVREGDLIDSTRNSADESEIGRNELFVGFVDLGGLVSRQEQVFSNAEIYSRFLLFETIFVLKNIYIMASSNKQQGKLLNFCPSFLIPLDCH